MEWLNRFNAALDYIEENLAGEITPDAAARIAACSSYHFQRIFPYFAGVTFSEYVRRRRMTAAAFELIDGGGTILDLAAKYGYESPTAFNRAFQAIHGVPPSAARSQGIRLAAFPRITFTLSVKGEAAMNYQIEQKEAFRIVGRATKEAMTMEDCFEKVPRFWQEMGEQGAIPKICALMDGSQPQGLLGVSTCENGEFSGYFIAVATEKEAPEGMESYQVPAGTWAIFDCFGPMPAAMQSLQQRIVSEWLPTSGYEYAAAPDIEVYFNDNPNDPNCHTQVWLPIVKKNP